MPGIERGREIATYIQTQCNRTHEVCVCVCAWGPENKDAIFSIHTTTKTTYSWNRYQFSTLIQLNLQIANEFEFINYSTFSSNFYLQWLTQCSPLFIRSLCLNARANWIEWEKFWELPSKEKRNKERKTMETTTTKIMKATYRKARNVTFSNKLPLQLTMWIKIRATYTHTRSRAHTHT